MTFDPTNQSYASAPPPHGGYGAPPAKPLGDDGLGMASLILGIVSFICGGFLTGIAAIVCAKMSDGKGKAGKSKIGFILGIIATILSILGTILALSTGAFSGAR